MRKKLPILLLALIILLQVFVPAVYAVSKSEAISSTASFCSLDTTPEGAGKQSVTSNSGNTYDTTPSQNHSTTTSTSIKGKPNSSVDILDKNGNIVTRRWFDSNGNQFRDVDFTNHGNPKTHPEWPHEHGPRP